MRNIGNAPIDQQFGLEPITIVEVQWVDGGPTIRYADRDFGNAKGSIIEISNLDFIINVSNSSDSAEITVQLDDTDGSLKEIIDNHNIHDREVSVIQGFIGSSEEVLIFKGIINTPIVWNEGDRTLRFTVLNRIDSKQIGFSVEDSSSVLALNTNLIGEAWPLKFGTTERVPALRLTDITELQTLNGIGIIDPTLQTRLNCLDDVGCGGGIQTICGSLTGSIQQGFVISPSAFDCEEIETRQSISCLNLCEKRKFLEEQIQRQTPFNNINSLKIRGGKALPQGTNFTLEINGAEFDGFMTGTRTNPTNVFQVTARRHPNSCSPATKEESLNDLETRSTDSIARCPGIAEDIKTDFTDFDVCENICESGFFWAPAGSDIKIKRGFGDVWVTNLVPETIFTVWAKRNNRIAIVPNSLYTTRTSDFNIYQVTEVVFPTRLSFVDSAWDDSQIWITSESSVGPNVVDVMEFLINLYSDLNIDTQSFTLVKNKLINNPVNFPILDRPQLLDILKNIAFQSRCAIFVRNNKFHLKFLAEIPQTADLLEEDDIDANSLEIYHSETEDIITRMKIDWKRDHFKDKPNKQILSLNTGKFGIRPKDFNFFIYNDPELVFRNAIFWMIRFANIWRKIRYTTPLQKLALEVFDDIKINLSDFADDQPHGLLEQATYDSNENSLIFDAWTCVLAGTRKCFDPAFPFGIKRSDIFTSEILADLRIGGTPNIDVEPPANHPTDDSGPELTPVNMGPGICEQPDRLLTSPVAFNFCCEGIEADLGEDNACPKEEDQETSTDGPVGGDGSGSSQDGSANESEPTESDPVTPDADEETNEGDFTNLPSPDSLDGCRCLVNASWFVPGQAGDRCTTGVVHDETFAFDDFETADTFKDALNAAFKKGDPGEPPCDIPIGTAAGPTCIAPQGSNTDEFGGCIGDGKIIGHELSRQDGLSPQEGDSVIKRFP